MVRVQHQDRDAFAVLVARHVDGIHAFNYRLTRHADDAADLAQETFLRVWSSARTWRPNRPAGGTVKFTTWLYRIARNLCIDAYRRHRETEELDPGATAADGAGPDEAPGRERLARMLDQGLAELARAAAHGPSALPPSRDDQPRGGRRTGSERRRLGIAARPGSAHPASETARPPLARLASTRAVQERLVAPVSEMQPDR